MKWSPLTHATVATPPCWGDIACLLRLLFHASSLVLGVVLSSAFSHPNVDSSIAAAASAAVLILSCSPSSFSLSSISSCLYRCAALTASPPFSFPLPPPLYLPPSPSFPLCFPPSVYQTQPSGLQAQSIMAYSRLVYSMYIIWPDMYSIVYVCLCSLGSRASIINPLIY